MQEQVVQSSLNWDAVLPLHSLTRCTRIVLYTQNFTQEVQKHVDLCAQKCPSLSVLLFSSVIFKFGKSYGRRALEVTDTSHCQISSKSVKRLRRYRDFSSFFFKMAPSTCAKGRAILRVCRPHCFGGVNRYFQAKRTKYSNVHVMETTALIPTAI